MGSLLGSGQAFEFVYGILVSKKSSWCVSGSAGSSSIVSSGKTSVKLSHENIISSRKTVSLGHPERDILVVRDMRSAHHKFNQVIFLHVYGEDLAGLADADHAISGHVADSDKDQLVGDSLSVDQRAFVSFEHEQVTHFCNHEDQSEFWSSLHQNREVTWSVLSHLNVYCDFELPIAWGGCADFHDVQTMDLFSSFLFTKAEDTVLVGRVGIGKWEICEASGITLNRLVLLLLNVVELHPCVDSLLVIRVKTNQVAPFAVRGNIVVHNLACV